jgi:hypothetical protein
MSDNTNMMIQPGTVKMLAPCFVTFKLKETEMSLRCINPFHIQKALDAIAGKVKNAT